ncbi:MAG: FtsX-like permease family protein [Bacteroidetes bacterium]|nr:FtsX-like permease family protein [Bacteroidota bacterium]
MTLKELNFFIKPISKTNNRFLNFANIVALLSVVVGVIALLVSLSILNGFDNELRNTARKFTSDISVQTINGTDLIDINEKINTLNDIKEITNINPVIQTEAILSVGEHIDGISMQSIPNDIEKFALKDKIIDGNLNFSNNNNEIIIGQHLAKKLNLKIDDKILIYAIKDKEHISFSSATYGNFIVKSIYNTGMYQYDNSVVFVPIDNLKTFLEKPDNTATYLEISLQNIDKVDIICKQIDAILGYPIFSISYYDINRSIFAWIELQKQPIPLVLAIISIVAAMNIITMLIITIIEKANTIGILRTLGLNRKSILKLFIYLSVRVAFIGASLGIILSVGFAFMQNTFSLIKLDSKIYFVDLLPVEITWKYVIIVSFLSLLFSFIASLVPSIIATRISPIKAIRFK